MVSQWHDNTFADTRSWIISTSHQNNTLLQLNSTSKSQNLSVIDLYNLMNVIIQEQAMHCIVLFFFCGSIVQAQCQSLLSPLINKKKIKILPNLTKSTYLSDPNLFEMEHHILIISFGPTRCELMPMAASNAEHKRRELPQPKLLSIIYCKISIYNRWPVSTNQVACASVG